MACGSSVRPVCTAVGWTIVLAGAATYFAALWLLGFRLADFSRKAVE